MAGGAIPYVLDAMLDRAFASFPSDDRAATWISAAKAKHRAKLALGGVIPSVVAAMSACPFSPPLPPPVPAASDIISLTEKLVEIASDFAGRSDAESRSLQSAYVGLQERLLAFRPEGEVSLRLDALRSKLSDLILPRVVQPPVAGVAGLTLTSAFTLLPPMPSPRIWASVEDMSALISTMHLLEKACEQDPHSALPRALILSRQLVSELPMALGTNLEAILLKRSCICTVYAMNAARALDTPLAIGASLASLPCSLDALGSFEPPQDGPHAADYVVLLSNCRRIFLDVALLAGADLPATMREPAVKTALAYLQKSAKPMLDVEVAQEIIHCVVVVNMLLQPNPSISDVDPASVSSAIDAAMKLLGPQSTSVVPAGFSSDACPVPG